MSAIDRWQRDMHPSFQPQSRFAQPPWDQIMGEDSGTIPLGEAANMFRYLYAKIEMLEDKVARLERGAITWPPFYPDIESPMKGK